MSSVTNDAMAGDSTTQDMSIDNDSTLFEEEVSVTHPRCYSNDHVEDLETFAEDLNQALKTSFPSKSNPYTSVHVLLFRWTDDDLGVHSEVSALRRVFETRFHFDIDEWQIPSVNPERALQKKLYNFQDAHQNETELLIIYYGGHAKEDSRRGRSIWQAHSKPNSPSLNWSKLQPLLEIAVPHVLIILDCCFAASAARDTTEGTTKEILAACGRENPTLGVGQRSFTSALIEEMEAFNGPFTAAMLHSRLVTMRWRLAFTPIYAALSERGGNSITICPFVDDGQWPRPESQILAELEATDSSQGDHVSMTMDGSPLLPNSQMQTVDTRVLLTVSVVQDTIHDVSHWVSWLTTAAPWDVTKVDVRVHSVFKSYSTLVVVSVPTYAWSRLPERSAYRFVEFIRSGDEFQAAKTSMVPSTETMSSPEGLPLASHQHKSLSSSFPSFKANRAQLPRQDTILLNAGDMETFKTNTVKPLASVHEAPVFYPRNSQPDLESNPNAPLVDQRHKRQATDTVVQPSAKVLRRSSRLSVSRASQSPPRADNDRKETSEHSIRSQKHQLAWSPENDELLKRARQQGLDWQPIASHHFPDKTANSCRKRHERLMEKQSRADNGNDVNMDVLAKSYIDTREQIWKLLADRVGEKWQNVEAKCMEKGLKTLQTAGHTALRREARVRGHDFEAEEISHSRFPLSRRERSRSYQDGEDGFHDSAIGHEDHPFVNDKLQTSHSRLSHSFGYARPGPFTTQQPQTLPNFPAGFGAPSTSKSSTPLHPPREGDINFG